MKWGTPVYTGGVTYSRTELARIFLAFRFHVNLNHSYRGDTADDLGFGQDIRIIRTIIDRLDHFNAVGVPVRGTWDVDNYFSLGKIIPQHCPDVIESLQRRVDAGDEIEVMSYNNGLISSHTAWEFDAAIDRAFTNSAGSGLRDLFSNVAPIVRPQEMMFTPLHLKLYRRHGIEAVSLFYSAVPFNAFSNFVAPLSLEQRFNPLTLLYPGVDETMTLIPAHNHGDIAENISLRWWLKRLRRQQLALGRPTDLLVLLDADADDEFWEGYKVPVLTRLLSAARGLEGLVSSVADLDFVEFTTPGEYINSHPPVGTLTIGQDTADGSFDGFSSWAEKWSSHQLWTGVERSRLLELQARRLLADSGQQGEVEKLLDASREARLLALSTTNFGLSSPVVNRTRLETAAETVRESVQHAARAFDLAATETVAKRSGTQAPVRFALVDYVRGISTEAVQYSNRPSRALVKLALTMSETEATGLVLVGPGGQSRVPALRPLRAHDDANGCELLFVEQLDGGQRADFSLVRSGDSAPAPAAPPVTRRDAALENGLVRLGFDGGVDLIDFDVEGMSFADGPFIRSAVNYAGDVLEVTHWDSVEGAVLGGGTVGFVRATGEIRLGRRGRVRVERELMLAAGLPYLYLDTWITYPRTRSRKFNKERARRLEQPYDGNWQEVMPCELRPAIFGQRGSPLRVWKHNCLGHVSSYDLNYADFSKNDELSSFNNHVTSAWVAVTDQSRGVLIAQTADANASFAFCPMRTQTTPAGSRVLLNPFGSYHGRQLKYPTHFSGLGKFIAEKLAPTCSPHAPSYGGHAEHISLLIAPYTGDDPPETIRRDAEAFAYPYAIVWDSDAIRVPPHRQWNYATSP